MPELPEVEITRRGIEPHLCGRRICGAVVRQPRLRWPVPTGLSAAVAGQRIHRIERRAKYLLLRCDDGTLIVHLGMTGSLRLAAGDEPPGPHDHVDLELDSGCILRFTDPRRFGSVLWWVGSPEQHPLLQFLGPEPLTDVFDGERLYRLSRGRRKAVKVFVMDQRVVAGVGNIYANEALHRSGIDPRRAAGRISLARYRNLVVAIKQVLAEAISEGGTGSPSDLDKIYCGKRAGLPNPPPISLRSPAMHLDFARIWPSPLTPLVTTPPFRPTPALRNFGGGRSGDFRHRLRVYGRAEHPCPGCGGELRQTRVGQRSTVYCPRCQR